MAKPAKSLLSQHEAAFASWLRRNGHAPQEAVSLFLEGSDYFKGIVGHLTEDERAHARQLAHEHLSQVAGQTTFSAQFPTVHRCKDRQGRELRYTITLTIGDNQATWTGRVWAGDEYLGEIHGSGSGPRANYLTLARMHIESQIDCKDAIVRRPLPDDYW